MWRNRSTLYIKQKNRMYARVYPILDSLIYVWYDITMNAIHIIILMILFIINFMCARLSQLNSHLSLPNFQKLDKQPHTWIWICRRDCLVDYFIWYTWIRELFWAKWTKKNGRRKSLNSLEYEHWTDKTNYQQ